MTHEKKTHEFWSTQPLGREKESEAVAPTALPPGLEMRTVEINKEIEKVHAFLAENYVEDKLSMFRLEYSKEFLLWQLASPFAHKEWNVGLFLEEELVGFISATELQIEIRECAGRSDGVVGSEEVERGKRVERNEEVERVERPESLAELLNRDAPNVKEVREKRGTESACGGLGSDKLVNTDLGSDNLASDNIVTGNLGNTDLVNSNLVNNNPASANLASADPPTGEPGSGSRQNSATEKRLSEGERRMESCHDEHQDGTPRVLKTGKESVSRVDARTARGTNRRTAVVNFLCLGREYRKKKLAPVMIREITERVNRKGIYKAVFTAGEKLPRALTTSRYYHKVIRKEGLIKKGFCDPEDIESEGTEGEICIEGDDLDTWAGSADRKNTLRRARADEVEKVCEMYRRKYSKLEMFCDFTPEQFRYYVCTREGVSACLVNEDATEFVSLFFIDTRVVEGSGTIRTAYLYYYYGKDTHKLMRRLVEHLKAENACDVLNALCQEQNTEEALTREGFLKGDGDLCYYLFNGESRKIEEKENGFISF